MLLVFKQTVFVRCNARRLRNALRLIKKTDPALSGVSLYREALLYTELIETDKVDPLLRDAENSVDEWTSPGRSGLGYRELVHYFLVWLYHERNQEQTVISFRRIIDKVIAAEE